MALRSTEGHNDNIYFEAAQNSRLNWALLNLENTQEAGLRHTTGARGKGQLAFYQGQEAIVSFFCLWERQLLT
jgi:hypothetical protein